MIRTRGIDSAPSLLVLHGVRILGAPRLTELAERFDLDYGFVNEALQDARARGLIARYDFFGATTWSLTDAGRVENERQLAEELDAAGVRKVVEDAHRAFLPLNRRHGEVCTRWQTRPTASDAWAANDHLDRRWDAAVLRDLTLLCRELGQVCATLTAALARFDGHAQRYREALGRVRDGDPAWLDAPDRASAHLVWMQVHEDLLATLGIPRGTDG